MLSVVFLLIRQNMTISLKDFPNIMRKNRSSSYFVHGKEANIIQLNIYFKSTQKSLILPIHYNYLVQSAIYNSIDEKLANFLHENGYILGKRTFKMFTFSQLRGLYEMDKAKKTISFSGGINLIVTSPLEMFCQSLTNNLLLKGKLRFGTQELEIDKISTKKPVIKDNEIIIKTLSPAVLYSTMQRLDGRKYTVYFQPGDPDYGKIFNENIHRKYQAFFKLESPEGEIVAEPLGTQKRAIINYKNTIIKGYSGKLRLKGPIPLLRLAVEGGIGSKNSQGFGCVEVI